MNTDNLSIGLLSTHPERSPAYKRQFSCRPGLLGNEVRFRSDATLPPPDPHQRVRALSSALALPSSFLRGGHVHEFPPPSRFRPQPFARPVSVTFLRPPSSVLRPSSRPSALRLSSRPALFRRFGFRASSLGSWGVGFRASCFGFRGVLRGHVHWCTDAGKTRNRLTLSHFVSREKRLPARQTALRKSFLGHDIQSGPRILSESKRGVGGLPRKMARSLPPMFTITPRCGSMSQEVAQRSLCDLPERRKARARSRAEHQLPLGRRRPSNERSSSVTETRVACQSHAAGMASRRHQGAIRAPSGRHQGAITRIPERLGRHDAIFHLFFVRVPSSALDEG